MQAKEIYLKKLGVDIMKMLIQKMLVGNLKGGKEEKVRNVIILSQEIKLKKKYLQEKHVI